MDTMIIPGDLQFDCIDSAGKAYRLGITTVTDAVVMLTPTSALAYQLMMLNDGLFGSRPTTAMTMPPP